jgi:uncharacterized LabA/DUF88 family protein
MHGGLFFIMERVFVIIDGSNLYYKLKYFEIPNLIHYNYRGLIDSLIGNRNLIKSVYYIGSIKLDKKNLKSIKLYNSQLKLFNHLFQQKIEIEKGFLMKNKDGIYHEKGVDVKMAVDLLIGAYENLYDTAILISSDTDLIPAIKKVREKRKNVEYIGFINQPSHGIKKNADKMILLTKPQLISINKINS